MLRHIGHCSPANARSALRAIACGDDISALRAPPSLVIRHSTPPWRRRGGFALLITITLLAFLVLLLVSLAALTRVETQVASNSIQLEQARQNALMGLQIALGQLQKHAGPDQRVTAPATTVYPEKDVTNASGELFTFYRNRAQTAAKQTYLTPTERTRWETDLRSWWNTSNRNPYWTAVFDSSLRRDSATLGKYGEFKRDQLPVWLVSGNERFSFDPATASSYPSGYFTPDVDVATLVSDPADVIELVSSDTTATSGDHISPHKDNSVDGLAGSVRVVRQPLSGTPHGATAPQTLGHYAYWVADESTKANFSVRDPWYDVTNRSSSEYRNRLQVPQRIGWERMEGFATSGASVALNDPNFEKALAHQQLPLIDDAFSDPVKRNFHHLTTYSRSIHTDTTLGGLKKDLTVFLEGSGSGISSSDPIFDSSLYASTDPRFGSANTGFPKGSSTNLPTWGQLKDWSDTAAISESSSVPVIRGRAPVVSNFDAFFGFSRDGDTLRMHWQPAIVLWNPYDTRLATTTYRLKWRHNMAYWFFGVATEGLDDPTPAPPEEKDEDGNVTNGAAIRAANLDGQIVPGTNWFIHALAGLDWYNPASSNFKGHSSSAGYTFGNNPPWGGDSTNDTSTDPPTKILRPTYRWRPFDKGTPVRAPWDPDASWVTYEFTADFEPGQVKVFTVGANQQKTASTLHAGTDTVLLENTYDLDFPHSYSFPVATLSNATGIGARTTRVWIQDLPGQNPTGHSLKLFNADTGAELWVQNTLAIPGNMSHLTAGGGSSLNPGTWRLVPPTGNWDAEPKNGGYGNKDTPIVALFGPTRVTPFAVSTLGTTTTVVGPYGRQRAFATYNLAAPSLELSTKIELSRGLWRSNTTDKYYGNRLTLLSNPSQDSRPVTFSPWASGWADGDTGEGYALLTYLNTDSLGNKGLSRLPMRQVRRASANILSLGQFQQANLSLLAWQPGFPVGNSEATPYVDRARIAGIESYSIGVATGSTYFAYSPTAYPGVYRTSPSTVPNAADNEMLDVSYLLNEGLWDRYFLSSIPQTGVVSLDNTTPLPNSRHRFTGAAASLTNSELRDFNTAAAWLENLGALNVNSTSVEAWKSLFTAFRGLSYASDDRTGTDISEAIPVSRTLDPLPTSSGGGNLRFTFDGMNASDVGASPTNARDYSKFFLGFRHLTDDMIQALAERIVDEVRLRGPFYSVADFVNRRLVSPDRSGTDPWLAARTLNQYGSSNEDYVHLFGLTDGYDALAGLAGLNGALQRAINLSGVNGGVNYPLAYNVADRAFRVETDRTKVVTGGATTTANRPMQMFPSGGHYLDAENQAGAPVGEVGQLLSHSPGFVTQADLLSMIGPALTARGDTFLIRTYGDTLNPATGETAARVWLEAVVQRTVEPVTPKGTTGDARFQPDDAFGRRFTIVALRWLGPGDI